MRITAPMFALVLALSGCASGAVHDAPTAPSKVALADGLETMGACLEERGWDIIDASTGQANVPEEQLPLFQQDLEDCSAEIAPQDDSPLSDEDLTALYDMETAAAKCLDGLGYDVQVPSLQMFMDGYRAGKGFSAHGALGSLAQSDWNKATEDCPPPGWTFDRSNQ